MNLRGEKISVDFIFRALTDTITSLDASLVDYSCAENHLVESVTGTNRCCSFKTSYVLYGPSTWVQIKAHCRH